MSRSCKKTPVSKGVSKYGKTFANRKVRRQKIAFRKSNKYRRVYEQWDVCDDRFFRPEPVPGKVYYDRWDPFGVEPDFDEKEYRGWWEKVYHRK